MKSGRYANSRTKLNPRQLFGIPPGPGRDHGRTGPPLMNKMFVETKGRIAGIRPGQPQPYTVRGLQGGLLHHRFQRSLSESPALLARTIVREKQDEGVIEFSQAFQLPSQFTYILIDRINTAGVRRHDGIQIFPLFLAFSDSHRGPTWGAGTISRLEHNPS